jgi:hypothetical protein
MTSYLCVDFGRYEIPTFQSIEARSALIEFALAPGPGPALA